MTPVNQVHESIGVKTPVTLDWIKKTFEASIGVWLSNGGEYSVEFTLDDINDADLTPRWFSVPGMEPGTTTSKVVSLAYPVQYVRVNITALSGSPGTLEFKVLQGHSS